jgi:hypothetical protein
VVVDACSKHLSRNKHAFADPRLNLIIADARAQLESWPHKFDVIIGDLADPLDGGPCYQLYTQVTGWLYTQVTGWLYTKVTGWQYKDSSSKQEINLGDLVT